VAAAAVTVAAEATIAVAVAGMTAAAAAAAATVEGTRADWMACHVHRMPSCGAALASLCSRLCARADILPCAAGSGGYDRR
jgi:Cu/Zn superoxide dismutase